MEITKMLSGGIQPVRVLLHAMALLHMHRGTSARRIAEFVRLMAQAIRKVEHRYSEGGIERAL